MFFVVVGEGVMQFLTSSLAEDGRYDYRCTLCGRYFFSLLRLAFALSQNYLLEQNSLNKEAMSIVALFVDKFFFLVE